MKHAKKYLLVPEERLSQFVYDQLSELDHIMHDIFQNKNLDTKKLKEKVDLNQQALQKYVNFPFPQKADNFSENEINMKASKITNKPFENKIKLEPSTLSQKSSAGHQTGNS